MLEKTVMMIIMTKMVIMETLTTTTSKTTMKKKIMILSRTVSFLGAIIPKYDLSSNVFKAV